jgi:Cu/Ag efflux protein CusF
MKQEKRMRSATLLLVALALAAAPAAFAQGTDHSGHGAKAASSAAMADGEVRKVDKEAAKITLKHGELKALDMPPMTMVFQVKDKSMLNKVKAGDKVRFAAEKIGGQLTVTLIEPMR